MKLSFYLFNDSVCDFEHAINLSKFNGIDPFIELQNKAELPFNCKAYFQKNRATSPKWLNYISDYFDLNPEDISNQTNSFLLLIKVEDRIFAVTTGFGFNALNRDKLEREFGLRVALNEIDPTKIKSIDSRRIDTTTKQKRVFINRNSPLYDFDFEIDEELLSLISGEPTESALGGRMVGSDSLNLRSDATLNQIGEKCEQLLASFKKETYKLNFGFIDNLKIVKDKILISLLDELIIRALNFHETDKIMLAYPEIDNLSQVETFRMGYYDDYMEIEEVDIQAIYKFMDQSYIDDINPQKAWIIGLNHQGDVVTPKYKLYDYLVFEAFFKSKRYLLTLNKWFEVAEDYLTEIDQAVQAIEEINDDAFLPIICRGDREDDYNSSAAVLNHYLLLDKKNISYGGRSKVEVCDLLTPDLHFVCVKKYNGSSTLSHLFNQGLVSAKCLVDDPNYRKIIQNQIPDSWPLKPSIEKPDKSQIKFVFAIASEKEGRAVNSLPFFSKVSLRYARKEIERLGFKVYIYKIKVERPK